MADEKSSVQTLIAQLLLDTSTWESTIKKAKSMLSDIDSADQKSAARSKASGKEVLDSLNKQTKAISEIKVKAAEASAQEQKKNAALRVQLDHVKQILAEQKKIVTETLSKAKAAEQETIRLKKVLEQQAGITKHLKDQLHVIQEQRKEESHRDRERAHQQHSGGLLGGLNGFIGTVGGIALGELVEKRMEQFMEKVKEFISDSGGLQRLTSTFEGLTRGRGEDPAELMDKLKKATHSLVPEINLVKTANAFLQSSNKLSTEEMLKLTAATVGLARANGRDAVAAVDALHRSFVSGRPMILAHVTNITKAELQTRQFGSALTETQRQAVSFHHTIDVINARYKAIGEPALTYTERIQQAKTVTNELFEVIAQSAVKTVGFAQFMDQLGGVLDNSSRLESFAKGFGQAIGGIIGVLAELKNAAGTGFTAVRILIDTVVKGVKDLSVAYSDGKGTSDSYWDDVISRLTTINGIFKTLQEAVILGEAAFLKMAAAIRLVGTSLVESPNLRAGLGKVLSGDIAGAAVDFWAARKDIGGSRAKFEYDQQVGTIDAQTMAKLQDVEASYASKSPNKNKINLNRTPEENARNARRLAQAQMEEKRKEIEASLAEHKRAIEDEKQDNEELYKTGQEQMERFYEEKRRLATEAHIAERLRIDEEIDLQKELYRTQLKQGDIDKGKFEAKMKGAEADRRTKLANEDKKFNKEYADIGLSQELEVQQAKIKTIDVELQAKKAGYASATEAVKNAFQEETITADEYFQLRLKQIQDEANAVVAAEQLKAEILKKTPKEAIAHIQAAQAALLKGQKEIAQLEDSRVSTALSSSDSRFGNRQGALQNALSLATQPGSTTGVLAIQRQMLNGMKDHLVELAHLQMQAEVYSSTWYKIGQEIYKTSQDMIKMRHDISEMTSSVGGILGASAGAAGNVVKGQWGRNLIDTISGGANILENASTTRSNVLTGNKNIFGQLGDQIKAVTSGDGSFSELGKTLKGGIQALGDFIGVIGNAKSPIAGGVGGAIGGAGLASSMGFGPWGQVAGAAGGAILGVIAGQKQQKIQRQITQLETAYMKMMAAFQSQNASLNTTISNLKILIAQAQAMKSNSKKGGSQFQDLIKQYNQQLEQLQQQQEKLMFDLKDNLAVLSAPQPYQDWIKNIQGVLDEYKKFSGAAQDAQQLADANKFLVESLQNTSLDMGNQISEAEQQAIQNALQLNDLYLQRNQIQAQYMNQVFDIMGRGNIVRQRTQAQTAYSDLFAAQVNYSMQLDKINQEIGVAQYKYDVESKVFSLATTRLGLESQLLQLQENGINMDLARILAMQNLLTTLQKSGFSIMNPGSIDSSNPNALTANMLAALLSSLGVSGGSSGSLSQLIALLESMGGLNTASTIGASFAPADAIFTAAYKSRAAYGYGAFRGQNL